MVNDKKKNSARRRSKQTRLSHVYFSMVAPGLCNLPVELLYALQLYALSHSLPHVSRRLYQVYKSAPCSFQAEYTLGRVLASGSKAVTRALRYPLCTKEVLEALCRHPECPSLLNDVPELPRRLFRHLAPRRKADGASLEWTEREHPLPFLEHLYGIRSIRAPDVNAHGGYALTRAVRAGFVPLVRFLLARGAAPGCKGGLAVRAAIRGKDLALLRMLVERDGSAGCGRGAGAGKRRRVEDRVRVDAAMLRVAVRCDARDIVEYLTKEKGCVPDMQTLQMVIQVGYDLGVN